MSVLPPKETLRVEFKSDLSKLPDRELFCAVVCLANSEGGEIYLGVEDDGTPTGLHRDHRKVETLAAFIANNTMPPVAVRVEQLEAKGKSVAKIEVPASRGLVATSEGRMQRRRLKSDGTPECVPFFPYEFGSRQSQIGALDVSAQGVAQATTQDLDPLERMRLRGIIERYNGEKVLLALDDEQLDGALGFTTLIDGRPVPTMCGLLLLGKEGSLRRLVPTHEVAFQVLDETSVKTNNFSRAPLLRTFEAIYENSFLQIERDDELQVGMFRVAVPAYDRRAFREAFVNALVHRDFSRMGAVYIRAQIGDEPHLSLSNPGGFVEGVNISNILVTEPRPRNPLLADVLKRIGLAERTGRGVDLIFSGVLRYGRPAPDYGGSDETTVVVRLSGISPDLPFLKLVLEEEERIGQPLPLNTLLALAALHRERRLTCEQMAPHLQKSSSIARATLERLVEQGLVEAHNDGPERAYTLSSQIYRRLGQSAHYIRQMASGPVEQHELVKKYVAQNGSIKRAQVVELCRLKPKQATQLLLDMEAKEILQRQGERRWTTYIPGEKWNGSDETKLIDAPL